MSTKQKGKGDAGSGGASLKGFVAQYANLAHSLNSLAVRERGFRQSNPELGDPDVDTETMILENLALPARSSLHGARQWAAARSRLPSACCPRRTAPSRPHPARPPHLHTCSPIFPVSPAPRLRRSRNAPAPVAADLPFTADATINKFAILVRKLLDACESGTISGDACRMADGDARPSFPGPLNGCRVCSSWGSHRTLRCVYEHRWCPPNPPPIHLSPPPGQLSTRRSAT